MARDYDLNGEPSALPNDAFDSAKQASASFHDWDMPDQVYVAVSRTNLRFQFGSSGSGCHLK